MIQHSLRRAFSRLVSRDRTPASRSDGPGKLIGYVSAGHKIEIRPAPLERSWMQATGERLAYRCLPLNIANTHGWEILCDSGFTAIWNGGAGLDAVALQADDGAPLPASSHFGHGVLTFHIPCLFRTT